MGWPVHYPDSRAGGAFLKFVPTPLPGAFLVQLERLEDDRGSFARTFCRQEFEEHGLDPQVTQCSTSSNRKKHTLRGLHYQRPPLEEAKLVRCTNGAIYDVIIDLRRHAETFGQWHGVELSAKTGSMLYVPKGFAHGYQTLTDDAEVFYQISGSYNPHAFAGIRWDDPSVGIKWPCIAPILSIRDRELPFFTEAIFEG
jgi:dTDP-4-dehydrorhamnose 3,5-epimerase